MTRPNKPPKPWERQKGEPAKCFRYFTVYRDMQTRSLKKLAGILGLRTSRTIEKYSGDWLWQKRIDAYDIELDRIITSKTTGAIADMRNRHVNIAMGMQTAAVKELQALVAKVEGAAAKARKDATEKGEDPNLAHHDPVLTLNELVKLNDHGVNLERLSRGEHTAHTKTDNEPDLSTLTVGELKQLKKLKAKITG